MEVLRYIQPVPLLVSAYSFRKHKYLTMDFGHFGYMDTRTISIIIIKRNSTK
jgi:hypothetical protein